MRLGTSTRNIASGISAHPSTKYERNVALEQEDDIRKLAVIVSFAELTRGVSTMKPPFNGFEEYQRRCHAEYTYPWCASASLLGRRGHQRWTRRLKLFGTFLVRERRLGPRGLKICGKSFSLDICTYLHIRSYACLRIKPNGLYFDKK